MEVEWALEIEEYEWEALASHVLDGAEPGHSLLTVASEGGFRRWSLQTTTATICLEDRVDERHYAAYVPAEMLGAWPAMAGEGSLATLRVTHTDSGQFCSLFGPGGSITTRVLHDARVEPTPQDPGGPALAAASFEVESLRGVIDLLERSLLDRLPAKELASTEVRLALTEDESLDIETLRPELRRSAQSLIADSQSGTGAAVISLGALRSALALLDDGPMRIEFLQSHTMVRLCWNYVSIDVGAHDTGDSPVLHSADLEVPDLATILAETFGRQPETTSSGLSLLVPVPGVPMTAALCDAAEPRVELRATAGLEVTLVPALLEELNRINATTPYAVTYLDTDRRLLLARVDVPASGRDVPGLAAAVARLQHLANEVLVPLAALYGAGTVPVAEHERCRWMMQRSFTVAIDRSVGRVDLTGEFAVDPWPDVGEVHIISTASRPDVPGGDDERVAGLGGQLIAAGGDVGWIKEDGERFLTVMGLGAGTVRDLAAAARCDAVLTVTESRVVAVSLPDRRRWTRRRMALSDVASDIRWIRHEEWDNSPELNLPFDQH